MMNRINIFVLRFGPVYQLLQKQDRRRGKRMISCPKLFTCAGHKVDAPIPVNRRPGSGEMLSMIWNLGPDYFVIDQCDAA